MHILFYLLEEEWNSSTGVSIKQVTCVKVPSSIKLWLQCSFGETPLSKHAFHSMHSMSKNYKKYISPFPDLIHIR